MTSTSLACSRCGTTLNRATMNCPVCGQAVIHASAPPTANSTRLLAVGGLVFATLAVLMLGGMSLVLWACFAHEPAAVAAVHPPLQELPVAAPAAVAPKVAATGTAPTAVAALPVERDVADLARPIATPVAPLAAPRTPEAAPPAEPRIIPVKVIVRAAGVDQKRVDAAIALGVKYLKRGQLNNGAWPGRPVGYTALAGLTLLECKVPAHDRQVRLAAGFIRNSAASLFTTYELSLAILFLDRLGNPADKAIIQGMALRLMSGQNFAGGWTYVDQPVLAPPEMKQLLVFLKSHRPPAPLARALHQPVALDRQMAVPKLPDKQLKDAPVDDPFKQLAELMKPVPEPSALPKLNKPIATAPPKQHPAKKEKKTPPLDPRRLGLRLQQLPIVQVNIAKGQVPKETFPRQGGGDNSNTQFALMGLWAARRHDVPTEYALRFAQQRFLNSQNPDGGWGYHLGKETSNTMTCVGLIGLAMGHGVHADDGKGKRVDPAIHAGLTTLGGYIGTPSADPEARPLMENLYFLWSVERVAMLYNLKTIGGKDWYGWGAQSLLFHQARDGHWTNGQYHAANDHCDTCFALLFLKRSNLVPDLTENLQLHMVIRDPEKKDER